MAIASLCFTRPSLSLDGRRGGEEVGEADPSLWGGEEGEEGRSCQPRGQDLVAE